MNKITVCASMKFAKEMLALKREIEEIFPGVAVNVPGGAEICATYMDMSCKPERAEDKIVNDWIRHHWHLIQEADAILVANYTKNGIDNYIGANSFLEMGFAHVLNKPVYILYGLPEMEFYRDEIIAMQPVLLNGDIRNLCSKDVTSTA